MNVVYRIAYAFLMALVVGALLGVVGYLIDPELWAFAAIPGMISSFLTGLILYPYGNPMRRWMAWYE